MASERRMVVPVGTPPAILVRLREATADIVKEPDFVSQLEARVTVPAPLASVRLSLSGLSRRAGGVR